MLAFIQNADQNSLQQIRDAVPIVVQPQPHNAASVIEFLHDASEREINEIRNALPGPAPRTPPPPPPPPELTVENYIHFYEHASYEDRCAMIDFIVPNAKEQFTSMLTATECQHWYNNANHHQQIEFCTMIADELKPIVLTMLTPRDCKNWFANIATPEQREQFRQLTARDIYTVANCSQFIRQNATHHELMQLRAELVRTPIQSRDVMNFITMNASNDQ